MKCEYCSTEHPPEETANPHYCIARLMERVDVFEKNDLRYVAWANAIQKYENWKEENDRLRSALELSRSAGEGLLQTAKAMADDLDKEKAENAALRERLRVVEECREKWRGCHPDSDTLAKRDCEAWQAIKQAGAAHD